MHNSLLRTENEPDSPTQIDRQEGAGEAGAANSSAPARGHERPSQVDVGYLRENYTLGGLSRKDLDRNPIAQFSSWFHQARTAELPEPNAMVLATAWREGPPTTRVVLLKAYDSRGFVFFTNYNSAKAKQIAENPNVAINFPWIQLQRQVNILGRAEKVSASESMKYFLSRPQDSQLGAWISDQSRVISSRKMLQMKYEEMKRKFLAGKIPTPDHWGGYRIIPDTIEFWQGRPRRLHDRFRYRRESPELNWHLERLAP